MAANSVAFEEDQKLVDQVEQPKRPFERKRRRILAKLARPALKPIRAISRRLDKRPVRILPLVAGFRLSLQYFRGPGALDERQYCSDLFVAQPLTEGRHICLISVWVRGRAFLGDIE